jgi:hypothetical protein
MRPPNWVDDHRVNSLNAFLARLFTAMELSLNENAGTVAGATHIECMASGYLRPAFSLYQSRCP